jgi:hypothetical protein
MSGLVCTRYLRGVHRRRSAVLGEFQAVLHGSEARITALQARTLQDLACVCRLLEFDAVAPLLHLNAQIKKKRRPRSLI